jgi:hypothetical protein
MKKIIILTAMVVCLVMASSQRSESQSLSFYLKNSSSNTIDKVYISPTEDDTWSIYSYYVLPNDEVEIDIPSWFGTTCQFDIKVELSTGEVETFYKLNACNLYKLTLYSDGYYQTADW